VFAATGTSTDPATSKICRVRPIRVMPLTSEPLESVRVKFHALMRRFDVHPAYKRFATAPTNDGGPHVEHYGRTFAYVVTERGMEYERRETKDPEELLYWLVSDAAREAAQQYELRNRVPGRDSRRLLFRKHVEFLESIRPDWGSRKRAEYDAVLELHPYRDEA
jgi:hypothetical protein